MSFRDDITDYYKRLSGKERIKITDGGVNILNSAPTEQERMMKQKIWQLNQHVRLKSTNRRYLMFYDEYRQMDLTYPIVKAALDIYAEETVNKDTSGNLIKIVTENEKVKRLLEECFFDNLNLNKRAFVIAREFCKFGNVYAYLITRQDDGVVDLVYLPPDALVRQQMIGLASYEEQMDFEKINEYKFIWNGSGGGGTVFEPWEIVHWKNTEDLESEPYGVSILRPIVETWRRVILLREALIVYRITRAPQRYLFKIATDGLTGEEAYKFAQEVKKEVKKKPLVDARTGEIDFKHNPMSVMDDFFIPVSANNNSDITTLDGASNLDSIEDYKIIKDDLFAGLKIPRAYLTFEENLCLRSNTFVSTLEGVEYSLLELTEKFNNGEKIYVYSSDENGDIVPGEVEFAGPTKKTNILYRITLDNGEFIECTDNHPWRMKDGSYKIAAELKLEDSLMPLYRKSSKGSLKGYEEVFHNGKKEWQKTHQLVGELKYPGYYDRKNTIIHHKNFNKKDNSPINLIEMTRKEHSDLHIKACASILTPESRAKLKLIQQTPEFKEKCSESRKLGYELNPWRKKSVSKANKKYGKAKLMLTAYLKKIESGEFCMKGEESSNYKGLIDSTQLEEVLNNKVFFSAKELKTYINTLYKDTRRHYQMTDLCNILNITKKQFEEKYINNQNWKSTIEELNIEYIKELILSGQSSREIYSYINRGWTCVNTYFQKNFNLTFAQWREKIEKENNIPTKNELLSILKEKKFSSLENINESIKKALKRKLPFYSLERVSEILGCNSKALEKRFIPYNHKVKLIEIIQLEEEEEVYDLKIKEYHNFATTAGVFVHNSNKAALSEEDSRFAKTIQRIQTEFIQGLVHIAIVHLFLNGCSTEEIQSFSVEMAYSSTIAEQAKWELMSLKLDVAAKLWDENKSGLNFMTYTEVLKTVFKFTDEEVERTIMKQFSEKKIQWRLKQLSEQGYYDTPELDVLVDKIKGLTPGSDLSDKDLNMFKSLNFESIKPVIETHIEDEIKSLFTKPIGKPTRKDIEKVKGILTENFHKTKKDLS